MTNIVTFLKNGVSQWAPAPHGLSRLCACLTWFDDGADAAPPWRFLQSMLNAIQKASPGSLMVLGVYLDRKRAGVFSAYRERVVRTEPLTAALARWQGDAETAFPDRLELRSGESLVCIIETEFWHTAGGPAPYHDSMTLSFYSTKLSVEVIRDSARLSAEECGASFEEREDT